MMEIKKSVSSSALTKGKKIKNKIEMSTVFLQHAKEVLVLVLGQLKEKVHSEVIGKLLDEFLGVIINLNGHLTDVFKKLVPLGMFLQGSRFSQRALTTVATLVIYVYVGIGKIRL